MVPRCLFYIFSKIEELRARGAKLLMKVSFIEIYNESVIDLLSVHPRLLTVREDALHDRVFVEGANEATVNTLEEVAHLLSVGEQNRTTGATAMNAQSSRSHSVFTISLEAQEQQPDGRHLMRHSQFRLVDLAGSERQKYSKSEGRHLREASNINGSLTVLGKVIMALASGRKHIPYRDSKLTFLLKNSLGGNSKTILIANIALAARCQDESLSTLKFASFARKPLIHVSQNVINPDETVQDLQAQILRLKAQLLRDRTARNGISSPHAGPDGPGQDQDPHLPIVLTQSPDGGGGAGGEYARSLEVSLRQALEREQALREKLTRERHQFVGKLDEYDWLCKSLDQCLESSKRIIRFKDIKIRDLERGGGGGRDGTGAEGLSAAMLPASIAAPAADPELVRARITIRALEEELALVRASEGPDSLAEREALEGEVTHLSEQVQILLARVYELEAAADQAGDVDHVQQLRQRDARVQELEERLQKLTTTLEDEKRAHISALELVQELREAEEEWAQTVQQSQEKIVQMQHQALPPIERNSCAGVAVQAVGDESKEPGEGAGQSCGAGGTELDEVQHLRELLKEKEATIHAQSKDVDSLSA